MEPEDGLSPFSVPAFPFSFFSLPFACHAPGRHEPQTSGSTSHSRRLREPQLDEEAAAEQIIGASVVAIVKLPGAVDVELLAVVF